VSSVRDGGYGRTIRRGISFVAAGIVLAGGGIAAAASVASGSSPASQTITITVPQPTVTTVTIPAAPKPPALSAVARALIAAAMRDPAKIGAVTDAKTRTMLTKQLAALDAFLAPRPKLQPYRAHLWLVAHEVTPNVAPSRLAALLWCTVWFPDDCG
jgi:hypothetical protein